MSNINIWEDENPDIISLVVHQNEEPDIIQILSGEIIPGPVGPSGESFLFYSAAVNISGNQIVTFNDSGLIIQANNTIHTHANKVIGMAVGSTLIGDQVKIRPNGVITEPGWNWTLDIPIFLGTNGLATQIEPITGFSLILGFPITSTSMMLHIQEPIFLV